MNQDERIWRQRSGSDQAGIAMPSVETERLATGEPFSLTKAWSIDCWWEDGAEVEQTYTMGAFLSVQTVLTRLSVSLPGPDGFSLAELNSQTVFQTDKLWDRAKPGLYGRQAIRPKQFWSNQGSRRVDCPGCMRLKQSKIEERNRGVNNGGM